MRARLRVSTLRPPVARRSTAAQWFRQVMPRVHPRAQVPAAERSPVTHRESGFSTTLRSRSIPSSSRSTRTENTSRCCPPTTTRTRRIRSSSTVGLRRDGSRKRALYRNGLNDQYILVFMLMAEGCFQAGLGYRQFPGSTVFDDALAGAEAGYCVDKKKVFVAGYSGGAVISTFLACTRGGVVRGIGTAAGGLQYDRPACGSPVAVYMVIGTGDGVEPHRQREERPRPGDWCRARHAPEMDGCGTQTMQWDPMYPECQIYQGCAPGNPVVWCPIGGGHTNGGKTLSLGAWKFWMSTRSKPKKLGALGGLAAKKSAANLVIREHLERLHHRGVIPLRAARRRAALNSCWTDGGHRKAQLSSRAPFMARPRSLWCSSMRKPGSKVRLIIRSPCTSRIATTRSRPSAPAAPWPDRRPPWTRTAAPRRPPRCRARR